MSGLIIKTDHSHICETAVFFYNNGIKGLTGVSESVNIGSFRKKVFCALLREIIVAIDSSELIAHANWLAADIVNSYGHSERLLIFMNCFITDAGFRNSIVNDLRQLDYKRVVDTLICNCGSSKTKRSSVSVLGNDLAQSLSVKEPKKAEIGVVLNSLLPFMYEVKNIRLNSMVRSVSGKHIKLVIEDCYMVKKNGKLLMQEDGMYNVPINYDRYIENIMYSLATVRLLSDELYRGIKKDIKNYNNAQNVIEHISRCVNYIKYEQALSDAGLRSLVTYY